MALTPTNFTVFNTMANVQMGAVWAVDEADVTWKQWATEFPMAGGSQVTFGWTGRMPKPIPWYGSRKLFEPAGQTYTVVPAPFESTYTIDQFIIEDAEANTMNFYWRMLYDQAYHWKRHPDYELRDMIEGSGVWTGTAQKGLDGKNNWSTAHLIDVYNSSLNPGGLFTNGTYCNDFTGGGQSIGGVTVGGAFSQVSLASLIAYMKLIPDESGETLSIRPDKLMAPSTLEVPVLFVLKAAFLAAPQWGAWAPLTSQVGTADNQMMKLGIEPIINPFLKNANNWFLQCTNRAFKPMIWVVREAPRTVPRTQPNDPLVWNSHRFAWGGWDRACPAWGPSFLMLRSGP